MSAIVPGDLVICVHVHCAASSKFLGRIKRVTEILPAGYGQCMQCGQCRVGPFPVVSGTNGMFWPVPWVRKIEPLTEPEHELCAVGVEQ